MGSEEDWKNKAAADTVRIMTDLVPRFYRAVATDLPDQPAPSAVPVRALFRILGILAQNPGLGLTDLACRLGMTKTNVSPLVEQLVQEQLLDRQPSLSDRRKVLLTLTDAGTMVFHSGWEVLIQGLSVRLDRLTSTEGHEFQRALEVLVRTLPKVV